MKLTIEARGGWKSFPKRMMMEMEIEPTIDTEARFKLIIEGNMKRQVINRQRGL